MLRGGGAHTRISISMHDGGLVCGFIFIFQSDPPLTLTLTCLLVAIATLGRVLLLMNIIKDSNFEGGMAGMMHDGPLLYARTSTTN